MILKAGISFDNQSYNLMLVNLSFKSRNISTEIKYFFSPLSSNFFTPTRYHNIFIPQHYHQLGRKTLPQVSVKTLEEFVLYIQLTVCATSRVSYCWVKCCKNSEYLTEIYRAVVRGRRTGCKELRRTSGFYRVF